MSVILFTRCRRYSHLRPDHGINGGSKFLEQGMQRGFCRFQDGFSNRRSANGLPEEHGLQSVIVQVGE